VRYGAIRCDSSQSAWHVLSRADRATLVSTARRREFAIDRIASANATGGEQEPIHEYALAVVVWVVREQPVPFVLLLASAISAAPIGLRFPSEQMQSVQCPSTLRILIPYGFNRIDRSDDTEEIDQTIRALTYEHTS